MALMRNKNRKTIILHKGDSFGWIKQKEFRNSYYNLAKKTVFKDISMLFDVICAQTEELANTSFLSYRRKYVRRFNLKFSFLEWAFQMKPQTWRNLTLKWIFLQIK